MREMNLRHFLRRRATCCKSRRQSASGGYDDLVKRRLFNLAAAVSLALFLVTVALWARSFWRIDGLRFYGSERTVCVVSSRGAIGRLVILINAHPRPVR